MKKVYEAKDVLLAVIEYYARHDCDNLDESVEANFIGDDGSVELNITLENNYKKDISLN